jgi:general secretion pathway protein I
MRYRSRAFTLIEVLVALAIVALGAAAVLSALRTAIDTTTTLRERMFAEWIAENRLVEWRTSREKPSAGVSEGELDWGGRRWRYHQQVLDTPVEGVLRIDIEIRSADSETTAALATLSGFRGAMIDEHGRGDSSWDSAPSSTP